jgi:hypothetical protein
MVDGPPRYRILHTYFYIIKPRPSSLEGNYGIILHLGPPGNANDFLLSYRYHTTLLDPGSGSSLNSKTAARPFQKRKGYTFIHSGCCVYDNSHFHNEHKRPFGCNGCVTAVAAGQSQRFFSGVGIFNWYYIFFWCGKKTVVQYTQEQNCKVR